MQVLKNKEAIPMANKMETYHKVRTDILENPMAACLTANEYIIRFLEKFANCQSLRELKHTAAVEGITRARRKVIADLKQAGVLVIEDNRARVVIEEESEYRQFYRPGPICAEE
jgi:hypothetical protein